MSKPELSIIVFAYDDAAHFGLLASGIHWWWAATNASTMRTDISYTPTDCFETFVQPTPTEEIGCLGGELHAHRTSLMLDRQEGLTKTYNRVHDPDEHADDIVRLREIHVALDHALAHVDRPRRVPGGEFALLAHVHEDELVARVQPPLHVGDRALLDPRLDVQNQL